MFKPFASSVGKRIRSNQTRLLVAASTAILAAIAFTLASVAANDAILPRSNPAQASRSASTPAQANKTYTLYTGFWRTDGSFVSTIRVKNVLAVAPTDVTPVLFMADGAPYMLSSVHVAVSGVATVNINDALATAPSSIASHISQFGSAALIYSYPSPGHVTAQMAAIDASRSLSYTYPFVEPMDMPGHDSKQVLEGLWWKHDPGVTGFITLSNTTGQQQTAVLTPVFPGNNANSQQVTLAPQSTQMLKLEDIANQTSTPDNRAGGIRVEYEGSQGAILVTGALANESEGYSANMPFWFRDTNHSPPTQITYATAGLMLGKPDPMMMPGFPKETAFSLYLSLRNTTEKPLDVALQLNYMSGMGMEGTMPVTRNLPAQHLAPFEARQVDLQGPLNAAGLKNFNGSINLSTSLTGRAGDLVLATGSVDQTGTYVFEVEPQGVSSSRSKFTNYWGVANGNDTMFTLWNPTDSPQDIVATFYYGNGSGKYTVPIRLDAQASTMIDMAMLIMEKKPDADGNIFPSNIQEGSAQFASAKGRNEQITLVIAGGLYNVATATCGSTCINCCGDSNFGISPNPIICPLGGTVPLSSTAVDCYGYEVYPSSWSSSNTSVMTVDNSGVVTGVAVGSANITANFTYVPTYTGQICMPYPYCPGTASPAPQAPATVKPKISGPNTVWFFSNLTVSGYTTSAQLTANGGDSSTTWNITAGSDKITVSSFTGSSINVLSSGTAFSSSVGDVNLTATSNGQTSDPFSMTTRVPYLLVPGSVTTACNTAYGYLTTANYEIEDQLLSAMPSAVPLNENWTTSVVNDYPGGTTNWTIGQPGSFTTQTPDFSHFADHMSGGFNNPTPMPTCDGNSTLVQHIGQEWRIGSLASGFGSRVQTDTVQQYIGHAAHLSIVSPAP